MDDFDGLAGGSHEKRVSFQETSFFCGKRFWLGILRKTEERYAKDHVKSSLHFPEISFTIEDVSGEGFLPFSLSVWMQKAKKGESDEST